MCSWCWGFTPVWDVLTRLLTEQFPENLSIETLLGGLAPDSDQPMAESMQQYLQQTWVAIEQRVPGTRFNFDFWKRCQPRRSTWPACRAVIAARQQGQQFGGQMSHAIQRAYYLDARNPSDRDTLEAIAAELGLRRQQFATDLDSATTREQHQKEMYLVQQLGIQGFPALNLEIDRQHYPVQVDFESAQPMLKHVEQLMSTAGTRVPD